MAQCPKDGTVVNLSDPSVAKNCSCPVCGAWVYPHLMLVADKTSLEFGKETSFGKADIQGLDGHNSVSRTHARFYPTEEGWNFVSLTMTSSSEINGTPVNSQQKISLHDGDQIKMGTVSLVVNLKPPPS
jgi:hypothetical protein